MAPPAERLNIAKFFIMSTPAGEVDEVVKGEERYIRFYLYKNM